MKLRFILNFLTGQILGLMILTLIFIVMLTTLLAKEFMCGQDGATGAAYAGGIFLLGVWFVLQCFGLSGWLTQVKLWTAEQ